MVRQAIATLTDKEAETLFYDWGFWARDDQLLPNWNWFVWLLKGGRGSGKTRTGAEAVRVWKENYPRIAIISRTPREIREVCLEGESGILNISPHWDKPTYEPSKQRITWKNGAKAFLYSAEEPDAFRGPQWHKVWADEIASWTYLEKAPKDGYTAWDNILFGLRLGDNPQIIATSTPRNLKTIKEIIKDKGNHITTVSSYANRANLSPKFFETVIKKYEGTRLGRQEIYGEVIDDIEGALWKMSQIDNTRESVDKLDEILSKLVRIVVSIDPAVTSKPDSDETGIIVVGKDIYNHAYVLEDISGIYTPSVWADKAIWAYEKWQANYILAESNNGGDLVKSNIQSANPSVPVRLVHATRGKMLRAEPVQAMYERREVTHVGLHAKLEDQMCNWDAQTGEESPDRVDALVHGITDICIKKKVQFASA